MEKYYIWRSYYGLQKVLRLHFVNHLSCREIAESCGDCSKTTVNEFLKRFRESETLIPFTGRCHE